MARLYQTQVKLLRANLKTFILGYPILNLLKVIVNHDPYFWGIPDRPPPAYLPTANPLPHPPPLLPPRHKPVPDQMVPPNRLQPAPLFFSGILSPNHRRAPHPGCTRTPGAATHTCWTAGSQGGGPGGGTRRSSLRSRSPRAS